MSCILSIFPLKIETIRWHLQFLVWLGKKKFGITSFTYPEGWSIIASLWNGELIVILKIPFIIGKCSDSVTDLKEGKSGVFINETHCDGEVSKFLDEVGREFHCLFKVENQLVISSRQGMCWTSMHVMNFIIVSLWIRQFILFFPSPFFSSILFCPIIFFPGRILCVIQHRNRKFKFFFDLHVDLMMYLLSWCRFLQLELSVSLGLKWHWQNLREIVSLSLLPKMFTLSLCKILTPISIQFISFCLNSDANFFCGFTDMAGFTACNLIELGCYSTHIGCIKTLLYNRWILAEYHANFWPEFDICSKQILCCLIQTFSQSLSFSSCEHC